MATAPSSNSNDPLSKLRIKRDDPQQRPRSGLAQALKWLAVVAGTVVVALWLIWLGIQQGWLSSNNLGIAIPEAIQPRPEVRLARLSVESGRSADATVVATGYLESRRQARIGARVAGRIEAVLVEEGARVKKDQLLAVLEHADLDAAIAAAKATAARSLAEIEEQRIAVASSKSVFERATDLRKNNSISTEEFEAAQFSYQGAVARVKTLEAAFDLAQARVDEAEQMRENTFVHAPFDGTVISKDGEVGESILPGGMGDASGRGSVLTIADLDHLEVDCDVKEDYISRIQEGQAAEVAVDAVPNVRYRSRVRKIIPMGDRARATIKVKAEILDADEKLFPDMSATVFFLPPDESQTVRVDEKPRVFIDQSAIQEDSTGGAFVWQLDDSKHTTRVPVTLGASRDRRTEILSGLSGDETVVIASEELLDGQLVKVLQ